MRDYLKELIEDVLNGRYGTMNRTELLSRLNLIQKECNPTPIKEEPKKIEKLKRFSNEWNDNDIYSARAVAGGLNKVLDKVNELIDAHNNRLNK